MDKRQLKVQVQKQMKELEFIKEEINCSLIREKANDEKMKELISTNVSWEQLIKQ